MMVKFAASSAVMVLHSSPHTALPGVGAHHDVDQGFRVLEVDHVKQRVIGLMSFKHHLNDGLWQYFVHISQGHLGRTCSSRF